MRKGTIIFLFIVSVAKLFSQSSTYIFNNLKEREGLSNNTVNCFLRDSRGILWIGTFSGLNRFDGSHFYSFRRTNDANSMLNNTIHALCEDKQRRIWGATENGLFCYDPGTNIFKNYQSPNSKKAPAPFNVARATFNVLCDSKGNIWATGVWTLLKFNSSKGQFEEIEPLSPVTDSLRYYEIRKNGMVEDPSGSGLWLATRRGLHFYDFKTERYLGYRNRVDSIFTNHSVAALHKSISGHFWFFDNYLQTVMGVDLRTWKIIKRIPVAKAMPAAVGATLFEDSEQRLWLSSWTSEIAMIDLRNGDSISRIMNDKGDPLSIAGDFFWSAIEDEDRTLWFGTMSGISKCNTSKSLYRIHRLLEKFPFLENNSIQMMKEDPVDKSWWLVTRNELFLIHYFPASTKSQVYDFSKANKNIHGSMPGPVYDMLFLNGRPVLATHNGAWQVEKNNPKLTPFHISKAVDSQFVIRNIAAAQHIFYFTDGKEILKYNSITDEAIRIKYPNERLKDGQSFFIGKFVATADHRIWFAMALGWVAYINDKNEIIPIYIIKNEDKETNGYVSSIEVDKDGKIWMASKGAGLYRLDPANNEASFWNEVDGLGYNHILNAIPDNSGNVWCAAYNKFSVFTPASGGFYNFALPLSENKVDYDNALALLSNGNVLSALRNYIVEFYPQRLALKPVIKPPQISTINISGIERLLTDEKKLNLEPNQNSISIRFGLPTDENTFPHTLAYKLDGFDKDWVPSDQIKNAVYNNLPPGDYTFRLIARANNRSWQSPERILNIIIRTPFYKTLWFPGLIGVLIGSALVFFYRFRLNKQKQILTLETKAEGLEKEKTLVQYESLKQHLNPHFLFNSLTSLRSLIKTDSKTATTFLDGMSKVYRYVLKSGEQELVRLQDELDFVKTFAELQKIRFKEGLNVNVVVDERFFGKYIVPVTLQNLVENAIKHNTADKDSPLLIDIFIENDFVIVRNNLQRYRIVETSNKKGLASLKTLYRYYSDKPVVIEEQEQHFTVKIPLL